MFLRLKNILCYFLFVLNKGLTQFDQERLPDLPKHLLEEFRLPLKENVNELTKNIGEVSSKVLLYLHQNYPLYFNRIEDVSKAVGYLSSADSLGNQLVHKEIFDECSLLIGVRGLLFSNTSVNGNKVTFKVIKIYSTR